LAGFFGFIFGEAAYKWFPVELELQDVMMANRKAMLPSLKTENAALSKNAALAFAILGGCTGGLFGLAGGLAQRCANAAARAMLLGAGLGLVLGAGMSLALLPPALQAQFDYSDYDLLISLSTRGLIWGLLGASAGLAFAVGLGHRPILAPALLIGAMGAVIGALGFELLGAAFFAGAATTKPIPETWQTRLLAYFLMTIATAAALAAIPLRPRPTPTLPPPK
jgi:hypothetical protein